MSGAAGEVEAAVQNKPKNFSYGADILDVGGESTRPGSQPVNTEEELGRVIPVIEAIASEFPDAILSIDTYKAIVAGAAFTAGAHPQRCLGVAGRP